MELKELSEVQREAVMNTQGPSLIIAGAGSGKTRVITYKIAYILNQGVDPSSIMALTFTNKAAKEMQERIAALVGRRKAWHVQAGTFHSIFARLLRKYAECLEYPKTFTIYDASDSKNAIKQCVKQLHLDEKIYKPNEVASRISLAKNYLVDAATYKTIDDLMRQDRQWGKGRICDVYALYSRKCREEGVMDFDDLLLNMNRLLKNKEIAKEIRNSISYLFVDEYQDTNLAQYTILRRLSTKDSNLTIVGDDSQSIYGFRGARIQNILNFRKDYPDAKEFRLERNYRSTQTIVNAANSVIQHNSNRLKKNCFSEAEQGPKIEILSSYSDIDEAASVAAHIMKTRYATNASYESFAILYRVNSQSRQIEEALRRRNIPYKVYAGHSFYDRKEIKDVLAYMRLTLNPKDDDAFNRIINFPIRGIGGTTQEKLKLAAQELSLPLLETAERKDLDRWGIKGATAAKINDFASMMGEFASKAATVEADVLAELILKQSGIISSLNNDQTPEGLSRKDNVMELVNAIDEFVVDERETAQENEVEERFPSLELYMENVALLTDADEKEDENKDKIKLMTLHASKGLEFPYVYITGMEENLFPSMMSKNDPDKLEEERRLFYVGMTRAESALTLSYAESRFMNGRTEYASPSRFLKEIDKEYVNAPSSLYGEDILKTSQESLHGGSGFRGGYQHASRPVHDVSPDIHRLKRVSEASRMPGSSSMSASNVNEASSCSLSAGDQVEHNRFGIGKVISISGSGNDAKAVVEFRNLGTKTLLLKYAKLKKI